MMGRKEQAARRRNSSRKFPAQSERQQTSEGGARQAKTAWQQRLKSYFVHHREVALVSLQRLIAAPVPSIMTWAVIAIALALPAGLFIMLQNAQQLSSGWDRAAQVSVYLKLDLTEQQGRALSDRLAQREGVAEVKYLSAEQALTEFKALSGFGDTLDYLEENPLPAVILLFPDTDNANLATTRLLLEQLRALPEVDQVKLDLEWVQRLFSIMDLGKQAVLVLGCLLSLAVLLVVGNTIRLAIEARRAEIVVVKLVGGTDAFVRRPFLYTGAWYGLGGGLLAWLLVNLVLLWLATPLSRMVAAYGSSFQPVGLGITATAFLLGLSLLLGLLGAWVAVGRHLHEIEPK